MNKLKKFCILTSQRSGSTWLKGLLDSHPEIRCFGELFLYRPWPSWPDPRFLPFYEVRKKQQGIRPAATVRYLDGLSHYPGNYQAIGFKLMYNQLAVFPEIFYKLVRDRFRVIHLVRANPLDVVISRQRMRTSSVHHSTTRQTMDPIQLNVSHLRAQLLLQEGMVLAARTFLKVAPLASCEITYEGLRDNRDSTLGSVVEFLGIQDGNVSYHSDLQKISTGAYRKRIANYDEVSAKLYGTKFARLLADE